MKKDRSKDTAPRTIVKERHEHGNARNADEKSDKWHPEFVLRGTRHHEQWQMPQGPRYPHDKAGGETVQPALQAIESIASPSELFGKGSDNDQGHRTAELHEKKTEGEVMAEQTIDKELSCRRRRDEYDDSEVIEEANSHLERAA